MGHNRIELDKIFEEIDESFDVKRIDDAALEITASAASLKATEYQLGAPKSLEKYLGLVRKSAFWLQPRSGSGSVGLDERAVLLLLARGDGTHVGVLPTSGTSDNCTTYVIAPGDGRIRLRCENDSEKDVNDGLRAVIVQGDDPNYVVKRLFQIALGHIPGYEGPAGLDQIELSDSPVHAAAGPVSDSSQQSRFLGWVTGSDPEHGFDTGLKWYDGLIYCTWNGLGLDVTEDSLLNMLDEYHKGGVRLSGLIIDDGWQNIVGDRTLVDFEADRKKFPNGLKGVISKIKERFPYIRDIGVWSTIVGYWNGFAADSPLLDIFKTVTVRSGGKDIIIPDASDAAKFYTKYFSFLSESGVTCLKIDNQATFDLIESPKDRGRLWKVYQDELRAASIKYFDGKIIYCMAMVPNIMLYAVNTGGSSRPVPVFRNSDDFFPFVLSSHYWHIYCNFYNTLYTRNLRAVLDFDMFQSVMNGDDPLLKKFPTLHAAARCLSGGPVYTTDFPGMHDFALINKLSSKGPDGTNIILRPLETSIVVDPYQGFDDKRLLPVHNFCGTETYQGRMLGVFNLSGQVQQETVELPSGSVTRSFATGTIYAKPSADIKIEVAEFDVFTSVPVISTARMAAQGAAVAFFGLLDNISGACGILNFEADMNHHGNIELTAGLAAYGKVGIYTNCDVARVHAVVNRVPVESENINENRGLIEITIPANDGVEPTMAGKYLELKVRITTVL